MTSILDGELAEALSDALTNAGLPLDVIVTRTTTTDPNNTPWDPSDDVVTTTDYPCSGWPDAYTADELANTLIQSTDIKVFIIVSTLAIVPTPADTVSVRDETYQIISVTSDPALAFWQLQARR
jgi:hypothetical protein